MSLPSSSLEITPTTKLKEITIGLCSHQRSGDRKWSLFKGESEEDDKEDKDGQNEPSWADGLPNPLG